MRARMKYTLAGIGAAGATGFALGLRSEFWPQITWWDLLTADHKVRAGQEPHDA